MNLKKLFLEKLFCAHRSETSGMQSEPSAGLLLLAGPAPHVEQAAQDRRRQLEASSRVGHS